MKEIADTNTVRDVYVLLLKDFPLFTYVSLVKCGILKEQEWR